ncbi:MAG: efflux RND transporter periplasmic adaptor subunit [Candidatus Omnitrophica bacterium]|nr:efflux RND transporter periplasmic adaptor subunit [Candidatus Omnitrophota bacterium]
MKNFKGIFLVFFTVSVFALISLYGLRNVLASENHQHKEVHGDHKHHDHGEDYGHDHDDDHSEDSHDQGVIKLSEESQQLGNIKVISIESEPLIQKILVNGRIAQDVENVKHVHSTKSGNVTEAFISLGQSIKAGMRLCSIAVQTGGEIIEIKAPISGTIIAEFIKKGDHVDGTNALYTIADMTRLSANFDVYEKDLAHIQLGQKMKVFPITYPDRSFSADIVFISPRVDESTFTTRIKAFVDNPIQLLKLGMSVRGEIEVVEDSSYLTLPSDAVQNVEGKSIVFVKTDKETFEKRVVDIKSKTSKEAAISGELKKGDSVVVSGAFILKSKLLESEMEHAHDH